MEAYDIFSPAEVERESTTSEIIKKMDELKPTRVFVDPITQFRYLANDEFQFRKQTLSFLRFLTDKGATVLFTSEFSDQEPDDDLQFMCDGIINLEFFAEGRSIALSKYRGSGFRFGEHSMRITPKGLKFTHACGQCFVKKNTYMKPSHQEFQKWMKSSMEVLRECHHYQWPQWSG